MFAGDFAPAGWMVCDGQELLVSDYPDLFGVVGTAYGGDGVDTFAVPDLRGRIPIHRGAGFAVAEAGGDEAVALTTAQVAPHSHRLTASGSDGNQTFAAGNLPAQSMNVVAYTNLPPTSSFNAGAIAAAGGGEAHDNVQPFLAVNFVIAVSGDVPTPD
jgi:microcystin-dependent protein